ncbi:hypothetical protein [Saccharopolyspora sp. CA-218241]|uniref:WXG100-like domain-containing protein n=1 Tax=Saccharopolyspora sp. CA-218241 TaxID=3240027 RepID=UPI003D95F83F
MPIPEPEGILWGLVRPLSGWPETNENLIRHDLAPGWRDGSVAFETASEFNAAPFHAAWPDAAGHEYGTRVTETARTAGEVNNAMARLATHADQLADKVGRAEEAIRTLMSAGTELAEGSGHVAARSAVVGGPPGVVFGAPYAAAVLAVLVPRLAGEVNDILDRTAVSVAAGLPEPGNGNGPVHDGNGGGGQFGSDPDTLDQELTEPVYDAAAALASPVMPDAAKFLAHYLDGTGTTMDVDPNQVVRDVPKVQQAVDEQLNRQLRMVSDQAAAEGSYGQPIPFSSEWQELDIEPEGNMNWHLAIGRTNHSVSGEATVHPPTPDGPPRVEVTYQTHIADRYDFEANDLGKGVAPGGVAIPGMDDAFISPFHRAGTAQDFTTIGESATRTETREIR